MFYRKACPATALSQQQRSTARTRFIHSFTHSQLHSCSSSLSSHPHTIKIHRTPHRRSPTSSASKRPTNELQSCSNEARAQPQSCSCGGGGGGGGRMEPGAADDTRKQTAPLAPGQFPSVCAGAVQRVAHLGGQSARHQAAQGLSGTYWWSFPMVVVWCWWWRAQKCGARVALPATASSSSSSSVPRANAKSSSAMCRLPYWCFPPQLVSLYPCFVFCKRG